MAARHELGFGDVKIILFVGRIEPLKGISQLLRALPRIKNGQATRLVIIGGDDQSKQEVTELQGLSADLDIEHSVSFAGMVKQEQMPYYYNAADVCVIPSYYESFGLVALESLACGTPVVATDVGDLKSIIRAGESGYIVDDNDPDSLAQKISLLLSRSGSELESAWSIRASVSGYDWSDIAGLLVREFYRVLEGYVPVLPS